MSLDWELLGMIFGYGMLAVAALTGFFVIAIFVMLGLDAFND